MRVLLTRPRRDSERIVGHIEPLGATCLIWPLTEIVPSAEHIAIPPETEALLFTSENAIRVFAELEPRCDLPALCVGARTGETAREAGFAEVVNAGGDASALARLARASGLKRFLYARGRDVAHDLPSLIDDPEVTVTEAVIYAAEPGGPPDPAVADALAGGEIEIVTIWSRRNAEILSDHLLWRMEWSMRGANLLAISRAAAEPLRGVGFRRIMIAAQPEGAAMVEAISAALRQKGDSQQLS